jgi:hypothetical protein
MNPKLSCSIGPIAEGYSYYLEELGDFKVLSLWHSGGPEAERLHRDQLVEILERCCGPGQKWSFSFIGPMETHSNLSVLRVLADRWPEVTVHSSGCFKETVDQAFTTCEVAFSAPHSVIVELFRDPDISFGWYSLFCGWRLEMPDEGRLLHSFKRDALWRFTIPAEGVRLGFRSSDDWDCIEFISQEPDELDKIQKLFETLEVTSSWAVNE